MELYGPTKGDRIRFGDTDLIMEIENDLIVYGDELVFGGGVKVCVMEWDKRLEYLVQVP